MKTRCDSPDSGAPARARRFFTGAILIGIALATAALPDAVFSAPPAASFRTDRVLVKPKEGISPSAMANLHSRLGARVLRKFPRIANWEVVEAPRAAAASKMLAAYRDSGLVERVEQDYIGNALLEP